ncbi:MAG: MBL fold metallo-hydrolase [bacterium]
MKLTFLGTRGYIEARSRHHRMHSSLMVSYQGKKVMIDCGEDWLGAVYDLHPRAIVLTHAHPDHAGGLKGEAPCPVYAIRVSWEKLKDYGIEKRVTIPERKAVTIAGITFQAFPVDHSTRAPAVGYRISAGKVTIFYAPDLVWIHDRTAALSGVKVYIGDAATISKSLVRKMEGNLIGHTFLRTQLTWCQKEGVPRAIFTHLGAEIVEGDERS